jgi:hypothetical protein
MECNGIEQSLEGWGITRATLLLISLAADKLSFDISTQDMFADPIFNFGDTINLYSDGVRVFSGTITTLPIIGDASQETQSYAALGPWYLLSRVMYQQERLIYSGGVQVVPVVVDSTRLILFAGVSLAVKVDSGFMIHSAITYAVNRFHIPVQFGGTDINLIPPMQEVRDISCADAILISAKWTPDCVTWFDYSVDPPALYCKRRAGLSAVTIDPKNESTNLVNSLKVKPRPDLLVPGVVFTFEQTLVVAGVQKVGLSSQVAGNVNAMDTIYHNFTLQGANEAVPEDPPAGIAAAFYAATSTLVWEGEIGLTEEDCTFLIRPGNRLLFPSNCPARFQTMNALIQQVQFSLVDGVTSVTFGPPNQLGPQDFSAMLAASRGVTPGSNLGTTGAPDGGSGNPPVPPTGNPFPGAPPGPGGGQPRIQVELCDGTSVCLLGASGTCGG